MKRTQFTFYESFYKAVKMIKNPDARAQAYDIICAYALYGEEPNMDLLQDFAAIAFELIKPNLDSSRRKAENGKIGGSKKQNSSKTKANYNQDKVESNKENEKENKKEKEKEIEIEKDIIDKRKRFTPPTVEEVQSYCIERRNTVDAERFVDFYSAKGWKVGNQPMKDWRAAVRTWEKREERNPQKPRRKSFAEIAAEMDKEGGT